MAQKNITGDLNVTGTYKQNGTSLKDSALTNDKYVSYADSQNLSSTQQSQARSNINASAPVTLRMYKFVLKYSSSNDGLEIHAIGYSTATYSSSTTISYVLDAWKSCFGLNVDVPCSGALRSVYFASMLQVLSCRITSTTPDSGTFYFTYLKPYNSSSSTGLTSNSSGSEVNLFGCSVTPIGSMTV